MNNPCIFLDRDGVLNQERGEYTYKVDDFIVPDEVFPCLQKLKNAGFLLIVITNQGGIAKGIYTKSDMHKCHIKLQKEAGGLIDAIYYSPYHPDYTNSLGRKPGTLLFERAVAKYHINPAKSWMIGDQLRDLQPAAKLGIKGILINDKLDPDPYFAAKSLTEATNIILKP